MCTKRKRELLATGFEPGSAEMTKTLTQSSLPVFSEVWVEVNPLVEEGDFFRRLSGQAAPLYISQEPD